MGRSEDDGFSVLERMGDLGGGCGEETIFVRLGTSIRAARVGILLGMAIEQQSISGNTNNIFLMNGKENDERRNRGQKGRTGNIVIWDRNRKPREPILTLRLASYLYENSSVLILIAPLTHHPRPPHPPSPLPSTLPLYPKSTSPPPNRSSSPS